MGESGLPLISASSSPCARAVSPARQYDSASASLRELGLVAVGEALHQQLVLGARLVDLAVAVEAPRLAEQPLGGVLLRRERTEQEQAPHDEGEDPSARDHRVSGVPKTSVVDAVMSSVNVLDWPGHSKRN